MKKNILLLACVITLGTIHASDTGPAGADSGALAVADNSHLGDEGYFTRLIQGFDLSHTFHTLNPDAALTININPKPTQFRLLKSCVENPANRVIFTNVKALGKFVHRAQLYFVVLSNDHTYYFHYKSDSSITGPLLYDEDFGREHQHLFAYISDPALVAEALKDIRADSHPVGT